VQPVLQACSLGALQNTPLTLSETCMMHLNCQARCHMSLLRQGQSCAKHVHAYFRLGKSDCTSPQHRTVRVPQIKRPQIFPFAVCSGKLLAVLSPFDPFGSQYRCGAVSVFRNRSSRPSCSAMRADVAMNVLCKQVSRYCNRCTEQHLDHRLLNGKQLD
jgi:hypothetical protein